MKRECERERKVRLVTTQVHAPAWTTTRRGFRRHSPSDARHASSEVLFWITGGKLNYHQHNTIMTTQNTRAGDSETKDIARAATGKPPRPRASSRKSVWLGVGSWSDTFQSNTNL